MTDFCFSAFMDYDILEKLGKKKHLPSGRKERNRCWADPFSRLIYIHWWRF